MHGGGRERRWHMHAWRSGTCMCDWTSAGSASGTWCVVRGAWGECGWRMGRVRLAHGGRRHIHMQQAAHTHAAGGTRTCRGQAGGVYTCSSMQHGEAGGTCMGGESGWWCTPPMHAEGEHGASRQAGRQADRQAAHAHAWRGCACMRGVRVVRVMLASRLALIQISPLIPPAVLSSSMCSSNTRMHARLGNTDTRPHNGRRLTAAAALEADGTQRVALHVGAQSGTVIHRQRARRLCSHVVVRELRCQPWLSGTAACHVAKHTDERAPFPLHPFPLQIG
jgi:hypothetical protein